MDIETILCYLFLVITVIGMSGVFLVLLEYKFHPPHDDIDTTIKSECYTLCVTKLESARNRSMYGIDYNSYEVCYNACATR